MTTTKRRIEITIEKHRLMVVNRRNHSTRSWCDSCGRQVQMITPDEAAQISQVSTRTIYRRIEAEKLHFAETEKGFSLICLQSLEDQAASSTQDENDAVSTRVSSSFFRKSLMKRMLKGRYPRKERLQ